MEGEFALIDALARTIAEHQRAEGVIQGIGDDAAVLQVGKQDSPHLVATVDLLVEDIHFSRRFITAGELGGRSLAVNISDVAAMAGKPRYALVSLALPRNFPQDFLEDLYEGMFEFGNRFGTAIVGGNVSSTNGGLAIDVTVLGEVEQPVYRSGAGPGDLLAVSGVVGNSSAGLHWLLEHGRLDGPVTKLQRAADRCTRAHLQPEPRVALAGHLARAGATAMIDISDGLASEVNHLVESSGVGIVVRQAQLPMSDELRVVATELGRDPVELALLGGEDYELVFTIPREHWQAAQHGSRATGVPVTIIGEVLEKSPGGAYIDARGHTRPEGPPDHDRGWRPLPPGGWNHFRHRSESRTAQRVPALETAGNGPSTVCPDSGRKGIGPDHGRPKDPGASKQAEPEGPGL